MVNYSLSGAAPQDWARLGPAVVAVDRRHREAARFRSGRQRVRLWLSTPPPDHLRSTRQPLRGEGDLLVIQTRSAIGISPKSKATLRSLGLRGIGKRRLHHSDHQSILSQINKVKHLVDVYPVAASELEPVGVAGVAAGVSDMRTREFAIEGAPARRVTFSGIDDFVQVELYDDYYSLTWSSAQTAVSFFLVLGSMLDDFATRPGEGFYHAPADKDLAFTSSRGLIQKTQRDAALDFARVDFDNLAFIWTRSGDGQLARYQAGMIATLYDPEFIARLLRATGSEQVRANARTIARDGTGYLVRYIKRAPLWRT